MEKKLGVTGKKLGTRIWLSFVLIGLVGQFAWTIENMYFNVFLYNTISTDPNAIATMVAASAAAATLTTLLMGALSDRLGKRKLFICGGYILWGCSTMAFSLVNTANTAIWFPASSAVAAAVTLVIVLDCVMTFFGSTANDAAFNAYVTDVTDTSNRGKVESVMATLPLISMLVIFGGFDSMTQRGEWSSFFIIFGALVTLVGVASIFFLKEPKLVCGKDSYFKNIVYGFKPSVIKENKRLYIALGAFAVFSIAVQVFFPYFIIYMQNYLQMDNYAIVLGIVLIVASVVSIVSGTTIDKIGKLNCILPCALIMLIGLVLMYFARSFGFVIAAGIIMMSGYMLASATLCATIRDYTPQGKVGLFQGIRMIFAVLLPMLIGPYIGAAVIKNSGATYVELGTVKDVPTPAIFLAAAVVLLLVVIPIFVLRKEDKKK